MKLHPLLLGTAISLVLSACNGDPAPTPPSSAAAPAAAAEETEAFYGDEAPVLLPAEPVDDHGHSHDGDADHSHDHPHDAGATAPARREHGHEHDDGSEPHDH
jgi:hypothetical protein